MFDVTCIASQTRKTTHARPNAPHAYMRQGFDCTCAQLGLFSTCQSCLAMHQWHAASMRPVIAQRLILMERRSNGCYVWSENLNT